MVEWNGMEGVLQGERSLLMQFFIKALQLKYDHQGPELSVVLLLLNKKQDSTSHFCEELHEQRPFTL